MTNGCRVYTIISGTWVHVRTACPVYGTTRASYQRDYESSQPMTQFAAAAKQMARDDHKEEHSGN